MNTLNADAAVTPVVVGLAFPPLFSGNTGGCDLSRDLVSGFGRRFIFYFVSQYFILYFGYILVVTHSFGLL